MWINDPPPPLNSALRVAYFEMASAGKKPRGSQASSPGGRLISLGFLYFKGGVAPGPKAPGVAKSGGPPIELPPGLPTPELLAEPPEAPPAPPPEPPLPPPCANASVELRAIAVANVNALSFMSGPRS